MNAQHISNERKALAVRCAELSANLKEARRQRDILSKEWERLANALIKFQRIKFQREIAQPYWTLKTPPRSK